MSKSILDEHPNIRFAVLKSGEFRAKREDAEDPIIEGYFSVFNSNYELWEGASESIAPGAFDSSLNNDVRALTNHDTTLVLGRSNGTVHTLELSVDSHGLFGRIHINPKDVDAMNTLARVERGDVSQCSFGFDIKSQETEFRDDGSVHWTITDVELYEVSICTFPAYEATSVKARHKDVEDIKSRQLDVWKAGMRSRFAKNNTEENDNA